MYVLKHKKNRVYLKYYKKDGFKHYVKDINNATFFESKKEVKEILNGYKYPNNWEILKTAYKSKNI